MKKNNTDIINKINAYQYTKYIKPTMEGNNMKLSDLRISCNKCKVNFTPSNDRAKTFMDTKGHLPIECKDCYIEKEA